MKVERTALPEVLLIEPRAHRDARGWFYESWNRRTFREATGVLAGEAKKLGALLVHYSTGCVFDGEKPGAYREDDAPHPVNVYGESKLAGERA